jgi:hypothetical protein
MRIIDNLEAKRLSRIDLGFPRERTVMAIERSAEAMRAVVWALTRAGHNPAFTTSILNKFSELIPGQWTPTIHAQDSASPDSARAILEDLNTLGDVDTIGAGYWLPTPLRFVVTKDKHWSIVIGGNPTFLLDSELRNCVTWSHASRLVQGVATERFDGVRVQDINEWAGIPDTDLDEWTRETIEKLNQCPFEESSESFEAYAPNVSKGTDFQYKRWKVVSSKLPDGRYLAKQIVGPMSHYAIVIVGGGDIKSSAAISPRIDSRRLRYGMDRTAGNSVRFKLSKEGSIYRLLVTSEVPKGEYRLFHALGTLSVPTTSYYPRIWSFTKDMIDEVTMALSNLGIRTFN